MKKILVIILFSLVSLSTLCFAQIDYSIKLDLGAADNYITKNDDGTYRLLVPLHIRRNGSAFDLTCQTIEGCYGAYHGFAVSYNSFTDELRIYDSLVDRYTWIEQYAHDIIIAIVKRYPNLLQMDRELAFAIREWEGKRDLAIQEAMDAKSRMKYEER